jgi:hypothetical protein
LEIGGKIIGVFPRYLVIRKVQAPNYCASILRFLDHIDNQQGALNNRRIVGPNITFLDLHFHRFNLPL